MSFLEASARVPLVISYPKLFGPMTIHQNVSNIDILPTLVDLVNGRLDTRLTMDGNSLLPHLHGYPPEDDSVFGEYCGEGTIAPLMMIRRGDWKLILCPTDPPQLFNLGFDPKELVNLATRSDPVTRGVFAAFMDEANKRWDFKSIHAEVLRSQRTRRVCWDALKQGRFQSWDYVPNEQAANQYVATLPYPSCSNYILRPSTPSLSISADALTRYIRSNVPLDELELRARYPPVDAMGREKKRGDAHGVAAAFGQ